MAAGYLLHLSLIHLLIAEIYVHNWVINLIKSSPIGSTHVHGVKWSNKCVIEFHNLIFRRTLIFNCTSWASRIISHAIYHYILCCHHTRFFLPSNVKCQIFLWVWKHHRHINDLCWFRIFFRCPVAFSIFTGVMNRRIIFRVPNVPAPVSSDNSHPIDFHAKFLKNFSLIPFLRLYELLLVNSSTVSTGLNTTTSLNRLAF